MYREGYIMLRFAFFWVKHRAGFHSIGYIS